MDLGIDFYKSLRDILSPVTLALHLGDLHRYLGDLDCAKEQYIEAIVHDPDLGLAYNQVAVVCGHVVCTDNVRPLQAIFYHLKRYACVNASFMVPRKFNKALDNLNNFMYHFTSKRNVQGRYEDTLAYYIMLLYWQPEVADESAAPPGNACEIYDFLAKRSIFLVDDDLAYGCWCLYLTHHHLDPSHPSKGHVLDMLLRLLVAPGSPGFFQFCRDALISQFAHVIQAKSFEIPNFQAYLNCLIARSKSPIADCPLPFLLPKPHTLCNSDISQFIKGLRKYAKKVKVFGDPILRGKLPEMPAAHWLVIPDAQTLLEAFHQIQRLPVSQSKIWIVVHTWIVKLLLKKAQGGLSYHKTFFDRVRFLEKRFGMADSGFVPYDFPNEAKELNLTSMDRKLYHMVRFLGSHFDPSKIVVLTAQDCLRRRLLVDLQVRVCTAAQIWSLCKVA